MKTKLLFWLTLSLFEIQLVAQEVRIGSCQSEILKRKVEYSIYIPQGDFTPDKKYPILYLLHGYGDSHRNWISQGGIDKVANELVQDNSIAPMILVMPDAGRSWYINGLEENYEEFFINEFIPHIESAYESIAEKDMRAVAGISMGGYGAILYSLKYPALFNACCALSPAILTDFEVKNMHEQVYSMFEKAFGERNSQLWETYNIFNIIKDNQLNTDSLPVFYMDCGDSDFLYRGNAYLHIYMSDRKINHYAIMRHGKHEWDYWVQSLPDALKFISLNIKKKNL
jgi:S-formylglutathione hydrolase FrmB